MVPDSEFYISHNLSPYEMRLKSGKIELARSAIPLKSWQDVVGAIYLLAGVNYADSTQRFSQALQEQEDENIVRDQIIEAAGNILRKRFNKEDMVGRMIDKAKEAVEKNRRFFHVFDYEALGSPLFKSQISIKRPEIPIVQKGQEYDYEFGVYNSETQDYPSVALARHFIVTPCLDYAEVCVPIESTNLDLKLYGFDRYPNEKKPAAVLDLKALQGIIFRNIELFHLQGPEGVRTPLTVDYLMEQILNPENEFGPAKNIELGLTADGIQVRLKAWGIVPFGRAEWREDLFIVDSENQKLALPPSYHRTLRQYFQPRLDFTLKSPGSPYDLKLQNKTIAAAQRLAILIQ